MEDDERRKLTGMAGSSTRWPLLARLGAYYFFVEAGAYGAGTIAATLLVKRAGPAALAPAMLATHVASVPLLVATLRAPPRSCRRALRAVLALYVLALIAALPAMRSADGAWLGLAFVAARLGRTFYTAFAAGTVAETLTVSEARIAAPVLVACEAAGPVVTGLLLERALVGLGAAGAMLAMAGSVAGARAVLARLGAPEDAPEEGSREKEEGAWLWRDPLTCMMGANLFLVMALRCVIDCQYARALALRFGEVSEMAGFQGGFDSAIEIATIAVQLAVVPLLLRRWRVSRVLMVMPALVLGAGLTALVTGRFGCLIACQFVYWLGSDAFNKPARQVLMGAVPRAQAGRFPVVMAACGLAGSLAASVALVPAARLASPAVTAALIAGLALALLAVSRATRGVYVQALRATLAGAGGPERHRAALHAELAQEAGPAPSDHIRRPRRIGLARRPRVASSVWS